MWLRILPFTSLPRTALSLRSFIFPLSSHAHTSKDLHRVPPDLNEKSQSSPMAQAFLQTQSGDHSGALVTLTSGLAGQGTVTGCLVNAAACCAALGSHLSALDFALTGVAVNPDSDPAWYRAVCAAVGAGKAGEAVGLAGMAPERVRKRSRVLLDEDVMAAEDPFVTFITRVPVLLEPAKGEALHHLRNAGHQYWREKQYEKALNAYKSIIASIGDDVARMLVLRASCHVALKSLDRAARDLAAASVIDSGHKVDFRQSIFKARADILKELTYFEASKHLSILSQPSSASVAENQREEEDEDEDDEDYDAERSSWCEETVASVRRVDPRIGMKLTSRVPRFVEEYCEDPPISKTDDSRTIRRLRRMYTECVLYDNRLDAYRLLGRDYYPPTFFCNHRMKDDPDWWTSSKVGDVKVQKHRRPYDINCIMGYSNVYPQTMDLEYGRTHVGVGFVDLGVLLTARFHGSVSSGPAHFVGYDMSAYAVAKSLLLLQMMKRGESVDSILQVCYSTGWSYKTLEAVESTLREVLSWGLLDKEVVILLEHWSQGKEVDLYDAQEHWLSWHGIIDVLLANVKNRKDRMEVVRYFMTGRLLPCDIANPVMYSIPEGFPELITNETVFWAMSLKDLERHYDECGTLMGVVVHVLRSRIERLRRRILAGEVTWDLRLEEVSLDSSQIHKEIRDLNPRGLSWSNLCDFVGNGEFHEMARACSAPVGTQHYLHTIHWIQDVKGTCHIDYAEAERAKFLKKCSDWGAADVAKFGLEQYLLKPPVMSPMVLAGMLSSDFFDKWCKVWFGAGRVKEHQISEKVMHPFSIVGRWEGTGYLSYTYDR